MLFAATVAAASKSAEIDFLETIFRQQAGPLPKAPPSTFDMSSFTPFCQNGGNLPPPTSFPAGSVQECIRWEEQELDMLLMYLDLIAVGFKQTLARDFYLQIRCLSRRNTVVKQDGTWEVCFSYDFSEHVGNLLANYILQDIQLNPPVATSSLPGSSRFLEKNDGNLFLTNMSSAKAFVQYSLRRSMAARSLHVVMSMESSANVHLYMPVAQATNARSIQYSLVQKKQTSCCTSCADNRNYYPNIEYNQCVLNPFGLHCCHKACKSLGRLRVGVASSTSVCCSRSNPTRCAV